MLSPTQDTSSSLKTSASLVMTMSSRFVDDSTTSISSADNNDPESVSDYMDLGENGSEMSANESYNNQHYDEPIYEDYMYEAFALKD
ncbi:hypothetical protein DPMN_120228 [Dreissena polymorpha]|uniref:Uncharacterized protein n=1 Tax=Dreissena polymorpha TaxID=45954 RepID=A0A9D4GR62_DREPO|nr:hypothetical protein DPMN_120228 [Dreissena polymorpha]